jgi:hypothetical protein
VAVARRRARPDARVPQTHRAVHARAAIDRRTSRRTREGEGRSGRSATRSGRRVASEGGREKRT